MAESKRPRRSTQPKGNKKRTDAPSPTDTVARLGEIAREVARLGDDLRPGLKTGPGTPEAPGPVTPEALRRLDYLAAMLTQETANIAAASTGDEPAEPAPRTNLAFSTAAPLFTADEGSVGLDLPGVGSVSVGRNGATASVDGVGSASVGKDGVSVEAGGANVAVGGDGASVSIPGSGTVRVGTDGSISVGPGKGSPGVGGFPGLPFPPIPCLEACEFKIPIPVPRFVAEPFEIAIAIPQIDASPMPIPVPIPTPSPWPLPLGWPQLPAFPTLPAFPDIRFPDIDLSPTPGGPIPIPYPTIGGLIPGIPGPNGTGYNPGIEKLITKLLLASMHDTEDGLRDVATRVRDWNEALGDSAVGLEIKTRQIVEQLGALWEQVRSSAKTLQSLLDSTFGVVTDSVREAAVVLRQMLKGVLARLEDLLRVHLDIGREHATLAVDGLIDVVNPASAVLAIVRAVFLIVNWIATRIFSVAGFGADLFEDIIKFGARLDAVLEEPA